MHLQRVQVPDFRVLKDVDITFERDFNPRVFPLGSQNGGGKSTLLQLIFILLYCSGNPESSLALKNLLNGFDFSEDQDRKILAIIDIWDGKKSVHLEFFVCRDFIVDKGFKNLNRLKKEHRLSFSIFIELITIQNEIHKLSNKSKDLRDSTKKLLSEYPKILSPNAAVDDSNLDIGQDDNLSRSTFIEKLKKQLSELDINLEIDDPDDLSSGLREKLEQAKLKLLEKQEDANIREAIISQDIDLLNSALKTSNTEYIKNYSAQDSNSNSESLLCAISNLKIDLAAQFLKELSTKIFLAAPSTQVFLFLARKNRKSLFTDRNNYYSLLAKSNSKLSGLFTYDFLAVDTLIESFKFARDSDFREALKTGEYGDSYKNLLKDLELLLKDKKVNLRSDFSGLTFTKNESGNKIELEPEDLSHGELKRLSIYIWLKHYNIQDAIVLMDEVDLALHPDWQYKIVSDLIEWEPSNQYILATHSYELCESLTPSHVKILEPRLTERQSK
jgi:predicted ATP-binding protein involved in virulence